MQGTFVVSGQIRASSPADPAAARRPRADALRNRERLMAAAKAAFADAGPEVSLDEIARRAGVGIGTLYRHFPTRDALVEAVYRREVQTLADTAARLGETLAPAEALRQWMRAMVDYVATKKLIAAALDPAGGGPQALYAVSGTVIKDTFAEMVRRAAEAGDIRADADPADLSRALVGFAYGAGDPGWEPSALRLIDILIDGLRRPTAKAP